MWPIPSPHWQSLPHQSDDPVIDLPRLSDGQVWTRDQSQTARMRYMRQQLDDRAEPARTVRTPRCYGRACLSFFSRAAVCRHKEQQLPKIPRDEKHLRWIDMLMRIPSYRRPTSLSSPHKSFCTGRHPLSTQIGGQNLSFNMEILREIEGLPLRRCLGRELGKEDPPSIQAELGARLDTAP